MAQVPYEHVEAPRVLTVDGVRAYNPGDPVPMEVARRLGLLDAEDAPPVLAPYGSIPEGFVDGEITVAPATEPDAAGETAEAGDPTPPAPAGAISPAPAPGATTKARPPKATGPAPAAGGDAAPPIPPS